MKRKIITFLIGTALLFSGRISMKADGNSFIQDGKCWRTTYYWDALNGHFGMKHRYHYDFVFEGDTTIKSQICKKMYVDSSLDGSRKRYLLAMYQEGQKVYLVPEGSQDGLLLYDFGAEVGERIEVYTGPDIYPNWSSYQPRREVMRVLDVEKRIYHGVERRCLHVITELDYQSFVDDGELYTQEDLEPFCSWWIEGLGKEGYPFDNTRVGMLMDGGGMSTWLCTVGKDTLYTNGTFDPTANQCMVDGGMSWIQEYTCTPSLPSEYRYTEKRHFYFKENEEREVIGGHPCLMLYASVLGKEQDEHIVAALYEEEGKVYFYPWRGDDTSYLLYDFRANEGDVLTVGTLNFSDDFEKEHKVIQWSCRVERVTEEDYMLIQRRCLYLKEADYNEGGFFFPDKTWENDCWIEGIGSTWGIESNLYLVWFDGTPLRHLLECRWMDDVYYHADETPDAIQEIHTDRNLQRSQDVFYDLTGRPVSTPTKGVYIRDGKKVWVNE